MLPRVLLLLDGVVLTCWQILDPLRWAELQRDSQVDTRTSAQQTFCTEIAPRQPQGAPVSRSGHINTACCCDEAELQQPSEGHTEINQQQARVALSLCRPLTSSRGQHSRGGGGGGFNVSCDVTLVSGRRRQPGRDGALALGALQQHQRGGVARGRLRLQRPPAGQCGKWQGCSNRISSGAQTM